MILEKGNCFTLQGKNYSYMMYVNEAGFLQHLYYGKKVPFEDREFIIPHFGKLFAPVRGDINMDGKLDFMPGEYGFYGHGDYREPTALVERRDGASMSRFRYKTFTIYQGVPRLNGLPHARQGGETLAVTLKDDFSDTEILLNYSVWDDSDILVRNAEIVNIGTKPINLKKAFSFCVDLPHEKYKSLRLCGRWAQERSVEIVPMGHGITRLQSIRGNSSHQTNPFLGVLKEGCTEEAGECYGFQLIYSGSFAITAEYREDGAARIQGGVNDVNFSWKLDCEDRFITPQAALCYSDKGMGGMSREYADFLRRFIIDPKFAAVPRPVVINSWEAMYFNFDEKKIFSLIDSATSLGIDTFVLDDGWFGKRDDDSSGLGDWFVNEKKLQGGLRAIIDYCKRKGMRFGLWFEPEMVCEDSDLFRAHPDWAITHDDVEPVRSRNQLVLDFSREEVVSYIFNAMKKILAENEIDYIKWDMNRSITECFSRYLPADRQGEFMHRYILGVYSLAERIKKEFPALFMEGCAGGGARFDAGMLYYFPQIWTSDDTDAYERTKIQWGTSVCYPVSSMSCHVSACPNHQTGRTIPFDTRGAVASLGATGYELDLTIIGEEEKEKIGNQIRQYKKIEELVLSGDLYRLIDPFKEQYFCEMLVSKDKKRVYVVGERLRGIACDYDQIVCLQGLDENKRYFVRELELSVSGKTLMSIGLMIPALKEYESWTWHLDEVGELL